MKYLFDTFGTPCGDFTVAVQETGAVTATAFGGVDRLGAFNAAASFLCDSVAVKSARAQVEEYFGGNRQTFDLPMAPQGTPFQTKVWEALLQIPFGETRSYQDIAAAVGSSKACRAVGQANGRNPICLIIPCHRVIGANGSWTGFAFGEKIKRWLLEHEGLAGSSAPIWRMAA